MEHYSLSLFEFSITDQSMVMGNSSTQTHNKPKNEVMQIPMISRVPNSCVASLLSIRPVVFKDQVWLRQFFEFQPQLVYG